jgi:uncharacterized delta-60 repeat protein
LRFQPNGRLVIAGDAIAIGTGQFFALARYRPGGSLDDGFGIAGRVVTPLPPGMVHAFANALLLRPDGRMVAAGTAESVDQAFFALARYRSNGSLDARFGTDG